jgi:hypothetical protein
MLGKCSTTELCIPKSFTCHVKHVYNVYYLGSPLLRTSTSTTCHLHNDLGGKTEPQRSNFLKVTSLAGKGGSVWTKTIWCAMVWNSWSALWGQMGVSGPQSAQREGRGFRSTRCGAWINCASEHFWDSSEDRLQMIWFPGPQHGTGNCIQRWPGALASPEGSCIWVDCVPFRHGKKLT